MSIIKRLTDEHNQILLFLNNFENDLLNLMENNIFDKTAFINHIHFIEVFADRKHHQREEKILFRYMEEYLGSPAKKLVRHGMLVEHNIARYYVQEMKKTINLYNEKRDSANKLILIGLGYAYIDLLRRHIDKENNVVYPFAVRNLSKEVLNQMGKEDKL